MKKNLLLIVFVFVAVIITSSCVMASTLRTLRPDSTTEAHWMKEGCSNNYQCAIALDGDVLKTATTGALDLYGMSNIENNAGDIEYVKVTVTAKQWRYKLFWVFDKLRIALKTNGRTIYGGIEDLGPNSLSYSQIYYTNPVTGWNWNWQEVNNLQAGMKSEEGGIVDKIYLTVKYNSVCGNEVTEGSEVCDSNSESCFNIFGYPGTRECDSDCYGWSVCYSDEYCGDEIINGYELCDGTNLNGETCSSKGYTNGTLLCNSDCKSFDVSSCYN